MSHIHRPRLQPLRDPHPRRRRLARNRARPVKPRTVAVRRTNGPANDMLQVLVLNNKITVNHVVNGKK